MEGEATYLCYAPDESLGRKLGLVLSHKLMRRLQVLSNRFLRSPISSHSRAKHDPAHLGQDMLPRLQTLLDHLGLLRDRQRNDHGMHIVPLQQLVQPVLSRVLGDVLQFGGDSIGRDEFLHGRGGTRVDGDEGDGVLCLEDGGDVCYEPGLVDEAATSGWTYLLWQRSRLRGAQR